MPSVSKRRLSHGCALVSRPRVASGPYWATSRTDRTHCRVAWTSSGHSCRARVRWRPRSCRRLVKHHRGDGVQGIEPTSGLVQPSAIKSRGRRAHPGLDAVAVLKGVMPLGVGHAAGIEPDVDEVRLAVHRAAVCRLEHDAIHHMLVQVDAGVVLIGHVPRHEVREGMASIRPASTASVQAVYSSSTDPMQRPLHRLRSAKWDRNAPIPRAAEVPIVEVLQPLFEASCAVAAGFHWMVSLSSRMRSLAAVARMNQLSGGSEHRAIRPPAVWVAVLVLLDEEGAAPVLRSIRSRRPPILRGVVVMVLLLDVAASERPPGRSRPAGRPAELRGPGRHRPASAARRACATRASSAPNVGACARCPCHPPWSRSRQNHAERLLGRVHRLAQSISCSYRRPTRSAPFTVASTSDSGAFFSRNACRRQQRAPRRLPRPCTGWRS